MEDDLLGASKHIEQCETCLDRAGAEVVPFDLRAAQPEPSATGAAAVRAGLTLGQPLDLMARSRTASASDSGRAAGRQWTSERNRQLSRPGRRPPWARRSAAKSVASSSVSWSATKVRILASSVSAAARFVAGLL